MSDAELLFGADAAYAINSVLSQTGFDPLRSADFWERWVSEQLGGVQTDRKAPYDVRVNIWGRECLGEIKFSQAFYADYGKHSRHIFKWLMTKPQVRNRIADAVILIGVDRDRSISSWVIPRNAMPLGKRSITTTAPSDRRPTICGRIDPYVVPVTELLPAFAAACHNRHDAKSRHVNASITRHEKAGQLDLIGRDG